MSIEFFCFFEKYQKFPKMAGILPRLPPPAALTPNKVVVALPAGEGTA
jgi:hypothetical protein